MMSELKFNHGKDDEGFESDIWRNVGHGPALRGYETVRELAPGRTWLARDAQGGLVVLKRLDPDCLRRGRLHATIRDRLLRVRELAHVGVAQLLAVEREGDGGWMVWEWVEGVPLEEYMERVQGSGFRVQEEIGDGRSEMEGEVLRVAGEVTRAVQTLHVQGIVHGWIHGRNVIVCPDGGVKLTHLSELLYTEEGDDVAAVVEMLGEMGLEIGDGGSEMGMREVRQRLMELGEGWRVQGGEGDGLERKRRSRGGASPSPSPSLKGGGLVAEGRWEVEDARGRRRLRWGSGVVAVLAVVFAVGVGWYAGREEGPQPGPDPGNPSPVQDERALRIEEALLEPADGDLSSGLHPPPAPPSREGSWRPGEGGES